MDTFSLLEELLEQDQFELILPEEQSKETWVNFTAQSYHGSLPLVYLMNDAVESFLVFEDARVTGMYCRDYEGAIEASFCREKDRYLLIVRQEDAVTTIHFRELKLEVHLYDYGEIGHFWMKGAEDLRQLEFKIAILRDKLDYLGEAYCNEAEKKLATLANFPPLNVCSYPAVPEKYRVTREEAYFPSEEAFEEMQELSEKANDKSLSRLLAFYRRHPSNLVRRLLAYRFGSGRHMAVITELTRQLKKATSEYPKRSFGAEVDTAFGELWERAAKQKEVWEKLGWQAEVLREEPFETAKDTIEYHVYVMRKQKKLFRYQIFVEEIMNQ